MVPAGQNKLSNFSTAEESADVLLIVQKINICYQSRSVWGDCGNGSFIISYNWQGFSWERRSPETSESVAARAAFECDVGLRPQLTQDTITTCSVTYMQIRLSTVLRVQPPGQLPRRTRAYERGYEGYICWVRLGSST